jgi:hypothetical protein
VIAALPPSPDALLASAAARGRSFYRLVRGLLDDLEEAAPWSLLYAPPAQVAPLRARLERLLELIERAPLRVADELERLALGSPSADERDALQEAEFYFTALHQMVVPDMNRLANALDQMPAGEELAPSKADYYCELAADLKGKYASALMGAAAALASEGRWLGVEVEALLFPEKAEEFERNERLLAALESAVAAIEEAIRAFPWRDVLASWRRHQHVDRYALADLVALRGHLLRLLTVANRRALYSGDYQRLMGREILLGSRLREIEALHLRSLDLAPRSQPEAAVETFTRLHHLLLELAALLDVEALRQLIGEELLRDLRQRSPAPPTPREGSAGRLDALALLLVEEDLKIFLKLLVGAVRKRSSLALHHGAPAPAPPVETEPVRARRLDRRRAPPPPRIDPAAQRRFAERLSAVLARLTDSESDAWKSFQMVHKLQLRLRVLPPALMAEMTPFLGQLERDLLPLLDEARTAGAVPAGAVDTLRSCHRRLSDRDLITPETALETGNDLARVARLLDSLEREGRAQLAAPSAPAG